MAKRRGFLNLRDAPAARVQRAMWRVSRDRWLHPDEVWRIGLTFSRLASRNPSNTMKHAIALECEVVGMIRGRPPAYVWEPHYRSVMRCVRKKQSAAQVELAMLKFAANTGIGIAYENHWRSS